MAESQGQESGEWQGNFDPFSDPDEERVILAALESFQYVSLGDVEAPDESSPLRIGHTGVLLTTTQLTSAASLSMLFPSPTGLVLLHLRSISPIHSQL